MSQINQITPQEPSGGGSPQKKNTTIYWAVIVILLAGCIYLFVSKNQMAEKNAAELQQKQMLNDSLSAEQASLEADFKAASAKIDQLVSQNSKLDSLLQDDQAAMAKLQGQIKGILAKKNATKAELDEAKALIAILTEKTQDYEERIAELERENAVLTGKNKVLVHERDSTVEANIAIKQLASVLQAANIKLEALKVKRNGKQKNTHKARRADVLRVTFDIVENRIAESGTKLLHLRIIAPDGSVLSNAANGSGMMTSSKGDHLSYTLVKSIPLTQNQGMKNVMADWNQDGDYAKGVYKIEIYHDGYSIGSGEVTLK